jgi:hypothetical protein
MISMSVALACNVNSGRNRNYQPGRQIEVGGIRVRRGVMGVVSGDDLPVLAQPNS